MAKHDSIAAVSKAIVKLLTNAIPTFKHGTDNLSVDLTDGKTFGSTQAPDKLAVTVFLYRVALNNSVRMPPQKTTPDGKVYRAPLCLDLFYLITPWAETLDMQHSLLGWVMRTLQDSPLLPASLINDYAPADPPLEPNEAVELFFDPLAIQDFLGIWDKFKPNFQTSATYMARLVTIYSETELVAGVPVQTREFQRPP